MSTVHINSFHGEAISNVSCVLLKINVSTGVFWRIHTSFGPQNHEKWRFLGPQHIQVISCTLVTWRLWVPMIPRKIHVNYLPIHFLVCWGCILPNRCLHRNISTSQMRSHEAMYRFRKPEFLVEDSRMFLWILNHLRKGCFFSVEIFSSILQVVKKCVQTTYGPTSWYLMCFIKTLPKTCLKKRNLPKIISIGAGEVWFSESLRLHLMKDFGNVRFVDLRHVVNALSWC